MGHGGTSAWAEMDAASEWRVQLGPLPFSPSLPNSWDQEAAVYSCTHLAVCLGYLGKVKNGGGKWQWVCSKFVENGGANHFPPLFKIEWFNTLLVSDFIL